MNFSQKLDLAISQNNSLLCIGLDPNPEDIKGVQSQFEFNKTIVDQTADLVCAYKPNVAFYSAQGTKGLESLKKTIEYIRSKNKNLPIILDAKRGDIGSTAKMYVKEIFDFLDADAVTVNPYLGFDALEPFFDISDKGIIVLCRTSNPGARDFQDLKVDGEPLFIKIAKKINSWNKKYKNLLMVVGAAWPQDLKLIRKIAPSMTFLVPGIGAQRGDLAGALKNGLRKDGKGLIIASARAIIYDQHPQKAAQKLRDEINQYR